MKIKCITCLEVTRGAQPMEDAKTYCWKCRSQQPYFILSSQEWTFHTHAPFKMTGASGEDAD